MKRLFWVGVGVVVTVVVARRVRPVVERHTPAGFVGRADELMDRAEDEVIHLGRRAWTFVSDLREAMATQEQVLREALLPDDDAVAAARSRTSAMRNQDQGARRGTPGPRPGGLRPGDEDDPLYEFF